MNNEPILDYLGGRGRTEPPLDVVGSVMEAVADTPQRRTSWFAPLSPVVAAVGAAAAVTVIALLVDQGTNVGPPPAAPTSVSESAAPTGTPSAPASASPTPPAPTPTQTGDTDLLEPGNLVRVSARSEDGVAGTITLERGADVGGYPLVTEPSSASHFFVEVFATYELESTTEEGQWGTLDWRVESADGTVEGRLVDSLPPPQGREPLGQWPGATVPANTYDGWMIFAIAREDAMADLELIYQPAGVREATRVRLRASGEAPEPVAAEWPRPDPVYVAKQGLPFTVLDSPEADALLADADTCTNPDAGYTVTFPESWYTNTMIGDLPACSWFSPVFYEATADAPVPEEIAIAIRVNEGAIGFIWVDLYSEDVVLDGYEGRRYETGMTKDVEMPTDQFQYSYLAYLDEDSGGRKLWAVTETEHGGDYELNKAVFDRIMASLEFTD